MLSQAVLQQYESAAQTFAAHVSQLAVSFVPLEQIACTQLPGGGGGGGGGAPHVTPGVRAESVPSPAQRRRDLESIARENEIEGAAAGARLTRARRRACRVLERELDANVPCRLVHGAGVPTAPQARVLLAAMFRALGE